MRHIEQKGLTHDESSRIRMIKCIHTCPARQKPPTRFFPVAPFFPAGSRPPNRPGKTCVLAMVGYESDCVSGPVNSVMFNERPAR